MTMHERIKEITGSFDSTMADFKRVERELMPVLREIIVGTDIQTPYGTGTVINLTGETPNEVCMTVACAEGLKKFSAKSVAKTSRITNFVDGEVGLTIAALYDALDQMFDTYKTALYVAEQQAREAKKKAEEERKAELKFQKLKEKALADFDRLANREKPTTYEDEFYYALGWLASHTGTISAALPDYLASAFAKYFGSEAPCRIVDSKKRTAGGWQAQWSWAFKMSLKKSESMPIILTKYLNPKGDAIANTSFVWDLVEDFGFQFGKKQNTDKILENIPVEFVGMFQSGLNA